MAKGILERLAEGTVLGDRGYLLELETADEQRIRQLEQRIRQLESQPRGPSSMGPGGMSGMSGMSGMPGSQPMQGMSGMSGGQYPMGQPVYRPMVQ